MTEVPNSLDDMNGIARLSPWWNPVRSWSVCVPANIDPAEGVAWDIEFRRTKWGAKRAWRKMTVMAGD